MIRGRPLSYFKCLDLASLKCSSELERKTWNGLEFLILLICFKSINTDSLHSILKGRKGLLTLPWLPKQCMAPVPEGVEKRAWPCRSLPPFCFLSLFKHVTLCDFSHMMLMTGRSVPEATEVSCGKCTLVPGRWALELVYGICSLCLAALSCCFLACPLYLPVQSTAFSIATLLTTSWHWLLQEMSYSRA